MLESIDNINICLRHNDAYSYRIFPFYNSFILFALCNECPIYDLAYCDSYEELHIWADLHGFKISGKPLG